jgi:PAS domain S-box-containing protein
MSRRGKREAHRRGWKFLAQKPDASRYEPSGEVKEDDLVRFRTVLDQASEAIFIIDRSTRLIADLNETAVKWVRLPRADILNLTIDDLDLQFPLEPQERQSEHLAETRNATRAWAWAGGVHRRRDGSAFPVEVSISDHKLGDRSYWLVVARECNERTRTEEALRENADKYRALFELSNDAVYLTARDGTVVEVNDAAPELFGYARTDFIGLHARLLYNDVSDIRKFQRIVEETGIARDLSVEFSRSDGSKFPGYLTVTLRRSGDGSVVGYQCMVRSSRLPEPSGSEPAPDSLEDELAGSAIHPEDPGALRIPDLEEEDAETSCSPPTLRASVPKGEVASRSTAMQLAPKLQAHVSKRQQIWAVPLLLGLAFGLVGWSGLADLGFPYGGGNVLWAWILRTVSLGLIVIGGTGKKWRQTARFAAVVLLLLAAAIVAKAIEHVAGLPFELTQVLPSAWTDIRLAIATTSFYTLAYCSAFVLSAIYLLRSSRDEGLTALRT